MEERILEEVLALKTRVGSLENRADSTETKLDSLETEIKSLRSDVDSLSDRVDSLSNRVDSLHRTMLIIEDAVTNKIPALFDAFSMQHSKQEEFEDSMEHLSNTSMNHSVRISVLEDTAKQHSQQLSRLLS